MEPTHPLGRTITFYSYKGGTGRSMALANVAWILACRGRRVLAIDWDLEAPGLHRYFRPFLIDSEVASSDGLLDLVDRYATQAIGPVRSTTTPDPQWFLKFADFREYVLSVNFAHFPKEGRLDFLPAGRQGEAYALKVSSFNWQNFYDRLGGGGFFEAFKDIARSEYDYILIDSRTGVSDTAGICSVQMPDSLAVCFTYNNQSIKGAEAIARSALKMRGKLAEERLAARLQTLAEDRTVTVPDTPAPFRIFPVPMRVDDGESERLAVRQAFARESFADLVEHVGPSEIGKYWKDVEVPHKVFYSYEEVLAPFKDDALDQKSVLAAFVRMTKYLTDGDVQDYGLPISPEDKKQFLDAFAETPLTAIAGRVRSDVRKESDDDALVRRANSAMASLDDVERMSARRIFSRLVRIGRTEEGGGFFGIQATVGDFRDADKAVIAKLAAFDVVAVTTVARPSADANSVGQAVALADDRLLKVWTPLQEWLRGDQEFLLWRQQLRTYLIDWEGNRRDNGALLSGALLDGAKGRSLDRPDDLDASELAYIKASEEYLKQTARARTKTFRRLRVSGGATLVAVVTLFLVYLYRQGPVADRSPSARVDSLLAVGRGAAASSNYGVAIDAYSAALRADSNSVEARRLRAEAEVGRQRPEAALADLDTALRLAPSDETLRVTRAQVANLIARSGTGDTSSTAYDTTALSRRAQDAERARDRATERASRAEEEVTTMQTRLNTATTNGVTLLARVQNLERTFAAETTARAAAAAEVANLRLRNQEITIQLSGAQAALDATSPTKTTRTRLVWLDDDPEDNFRLLFNIANVGFEVIPVSSKQSDPLTAIQRRLPALIVTDETGLTIVERLREISKVSPRLPVYFRAYTTRDTSKRAQALKLALDFIPAEESVLPKLRAYSR